MGQTLMHLPTKTTTVKPEAGKVFVRQQHVNPNKGEPSPDQVGGGEQQVNPATRLYLLKKGEKSTKNPKSQQESVGGEVGQFGLEGALTPKTKELALGENVIDRDLPEEVLTRNNFRSVGAQTTNGVYTFGSDQGNQFY